MWLSAIFLVVSAETFDSWGNINGVVSSNIFRQKDAPNYRPGYSVVLAYLVLFLFLGSIVTTMGLRIENKKRLMGQRDHWVQGKSESEVNILGDKRYVPHGPFGYFRHANVHSGRTLSIRYDDRGLFVETMMTSN